MAEFHSNYSKLYKRQKAKGKMQKTKRKKEKTKNKKTKI